MNKKILISSMLVFSMLLLMPIVPAVQFNTIKNEMEQEVKELQSVEMFDYKPPDKFPLLYYLVFAIGNFRLLRFYILWDIAWEQGDWPAEIYLKHPLILLRSLIIARRAFRWIGGWGRISDILGLNWEFDW